MKDAHDVKDEDVFLKMLENFDEEEIYELCSKVCEKYLEEDDELYKWFHDRSNIRKDSIDETGKK